MVFGMLAQARGMGLIVPIYLFSHYISSPLSKLSTTDARLTDLFFAKGIFIAVTVGHYVSHFMANVAPAPPAVRYWWSWVWQLFPIWISIIQHALAYTIFSGPTTLKDVSATKRALSTIRSTIYSFSAVSAASWLYVNSQTPFSLK